MPVRERKSGIPHETPIFQCQRQSEAWIRVTYWYQHHLGWGCFATSWSDWPHHRLYYKEGDLAFAAFIRRRLEVDITEVREEPYTWYIATLRKNNCVLRHFERSSGVSKSSISPPKRFAISITESLTRQTLNASSSLGTGICLLRIYWLTTYAWPCTDSVSYKFIRQYILASLFLLTPKFHHKTRLRLSMLLSSCYVECVLWLELA